MELTDVADLLKSVEFAVFAGPANDPKGRVAALRVPGGASLTRKQIDEYGNFVKIYGAKGLAYIKVNERAKGLEGINSPVAKFLNAEIIEDILDRTAAQDGDMIFFGADNKKIVADAMGALRLKVGKDLGLTDESKWAPLWVIDFPMFEDDGEGGLTAMHHPFTSPKDMTAAELKAAPENAVATLTIWSSMVTKWAVVQYVSIMVICSRRCLVFWVSTKRNSARNSASCSTL